MRTGETESWLLHSIKCICIWQVALRIKYVTAEERLLQVLNLHSPDPISAAQQKLPHYRVSSNLKHRRCFGYSSEDLMDEEEVEMRTVQSCKKITAFLKKASLCQNHSV